MSLPLWRTCFLISMPRFAKKPFAMPRSSGSAFAIGSVSTVIVVSVALRGAPEAEPAEGSQQHEHADDGEGRACDTASFVSPPLALSVHNVVNPT